MLQPIFNQASKPYAHDNGDLIEFDSGLPPKNRIVRSKISEEEYLKLSE